ncbi:hypothetical protein M407DRAFT_242089 [Tulasnella calospora MUT 4182]|uniref:Conidiation protein 6 n=1 Tax=Tulasnella calospora MUT 4182 TaxID=1051891 RepID=A0A0C3QS07_9AGAM|nr:hypothetical protein M407DRAFT_242089 [Tulasnella calospora MUT 4182]
MSSTQQVHEHRVAGGHKAAINNPNVSEEAKEHSRQYLEQDAASTEPAPVETGGMVDDSLSGNTIGGYKATLSNPRTSEAAKDKAQAILDGEADPSDYAPGTGDAHTNRVLGGYKATLKNPNVSEEAKEHAREVLQENGIDA